jgi:hypothetical protein
MMENQHDTPDEPRGAGAPESPLHVAKDEGVSERDHALFAHESESHEPESHEPESHESEFVAPEAAAGPAPEPAIAPPVRKSGGYWQKFTLLLAVLGLLAIGGGLAAIKFKDKDERLRAISDAIDAAAKDPQRFASSIETKLAELWASALSKVEGDRMSKPRQTAANEPAAPTPKPAAEPNSLPAVETPRPTTTPGWAAPGQPKPAPAARDELPAPIAPPTPAPSVHAEDSAESAALVKRIEQLEATAREALETARDAQRSAKPAETGEKTATPTADEGSYLNALEGRIDELADEIRKVREQLDQPKSETRVAPDAADAAASTQVKAITAAETLGLAQSLVHSLERGRPFAAEQAALAERGVDPQLLAALAPVAEQGAPTAARLLASFAPVAKRLRALEDAPAAGGSLTDQLLHDAGKLVHVRPAGERANASITELVARIESALAHDDLDGASEAFAKLPENARSEAKAFGEALNQRREAEQAATSLLANALAGLAHLKN